MQIVFDKHIPFLAETMQKGWPQVEIIPLKPEEMDAEAVKDADVIVVRTRTSVNRSLLANSKVRLVCTATIGFDHIDTDYCDSHNIKWVSCPGCNAQAVCDYIEEALDELRPEINHEKKTELTIGIVGVGHVGSLVAQMAKKKGLNVLLNDPIRAEQETYFRSISLDEIAKKCDIITFHTPLTYNTKYPTYYLCDEFLLRDCKPNALIINAARGGVVDEKALVASNRPFILDTWENEPNINTKVLSKALLASMHIAGYSLDGKRNASQMCLDAIADEYSIPRLAIDSSYTSLGDNKPGWLSRITTQLKANPESFEKLRKEYFLR